MRHTGRKFAIYPAYLDVTDHPALFTVVNADSCEQLHFLVPFDAERAQAWSDRAVVVIEATRAGELLSRITDDPDDWRCKACGHRERCWRQGEGDLSPAAGPRIPADLSIQISCGALPTGVCHDLDGYS